MQKNGPCFDITHLSFQTWFPVVRSTNPTSALTNHSRHTCSPSRTHTHTKSSLTLSPSLNPVCVGEHVRRACVWGRVREKVLARWVSLLCLKSETRLWDGEVILECRLWRFVDLNGSSSSLKATNLRGAYVCVCVWARQKFEKGTVKLHVCTCDRGCAFALSVISSNAREKKKTGRVRDMESVSFTPSFPPSLFSHTLFSHTHALSLRSAKFKQQCCGINPSIETKSKTKSCTIV